MMDPPNGSLPQVNFSKTSDLDHLDQSHHTHMNIAQDPDLGPTQTPKIVIETTNVEISDDRGSSTARVAYSPASRAKKSVRWSQDLVEERTLPPLEKSDNNNNSYYVNRSRGLNDSDAAGFNMNNSMVSIKDTFGRWRKKVGEATKKAEDLAGNTWQHLKTAPSLTDGALGRIAQGTKVLAEGGYEKIFRQTFETVPEELLVNSYACYLSTSAGPVLGVIYVSTAKIAFCSDSPMSYKTGDKTEWSYYKVIIPFQQMKAVNPSSSRAKSAEKYIQVISVDGHEFWYMGFLNYDGAVKCLQDALQARSASSIV